MIKPQVTFCVRVSSSYTGATIIRLIKAFLDYHKNTRQMMDYQEIIHHLEIDPSKDECNLALHKYVLFIITAA